MPGPSPRELHIRWQHMLGLRDAFRLFLAKGNQPFDRGPEARFGVFIFRFLDEPQIFRIVLPPFPILPAKDRTCPFASIHAAG